VSDKGASLASDAHVLNAEDLRRLVAVFTILNRWYEERRR
jgi:hypothetical protein